MLRPPDDKPLRIVWLVKRFWPHLGGVEKYVAELSRALLELGHEVHVVAGDPSGTLRPLEPHDGVHVHRFPIARSRWRLTWTLRRLRRHFSEADVVQVSDVEMLELYIRALEPVVGPRSLSLTRHGMSAHDPPLRSELARHDRARRTVSALFDDGTFIQRRYGQTPDCVPDPGLRPTADEILQRPPPARPSAVFIGRLEPDSGIDLYFDALACMRDLHGLRLPLVVCGEGALRERLVERARRERLDVTWNAPGHAAQELLLDGTLAFVSGRMAIFEAMARRRPVVAACVAPLKTDYLMGEWFSPYIGIARDGPGLASLTLRLLRDPAARERFVEDAFQQVRRLSWRATAEQYLAVWRGRPAPHLIERRADAGEALLRGASSNQRPYRVTSAAP